MTQPAAVSIVVVSRPDRTRSLRRSLIALSQQRYDPFEIVVVADAGARSMLRELPLAAHVKAVASEGADLVEARNIGIAHADGEVVAFIEDDAIAEPSWLSHLATPFQVNEVAAATGFVRGPNGFSWKSRAATIDKTGRTHPLHVDEFQPTLLTASPGQAVRTHAANMAVRRTTLEDLGGFDPGFRQAMGVADMNLRLAQRSATTAVVPRAQVYHGIATGPSEPDSARRSTALAGPDPAETGAAWAFFLRRHCEPARHLKVWKRVLRSERQRLVGHMLTGRLEPRDVRRRLRAMRDGFEDGLDRRQTLLRPVQALGGGFLTFPSNRVESIVLAGRGRQAKHLRQDAVQQVAAGRIVTVMLFSRSARYHRLYYTDQGFWEQSGGQFGRSERGQRLFRFQLFRTRVAEETDRIRDLRLISG